MISKEEAINTINKHSYSDYSSGIDCTFYRYNDKYGIKLYSELKKRDYSYKLQKVAARHGFAPNCWNRFTLKRKDYSSFGFITEAIDITLEKKWDTMYPRENCCELAMLYHKTHPLHSLWEAMDKIGIRVYDAHHQNYGFMGDKPVCIDFGSPDRHVEWHGRKTYTIYDASQFTKIRADVEYEIPKSKHSK